MEVGNCLMSITVTKIQRPPNNVSGCTVRERSQHMILPGFSIVSENAVFHDRQWFCSLYTLDGEYLITDYDTTGSGEVACHP